MPNKLDPAHVRRETLATIEKLRQRLEVAAIIREELAHFNGKRVTDKFRTRLGERAPKFTFSLDGVKDSHRYLRVYRWQSLGSRDVGSFWIGKGSDSRDAGIETTDVFDYAHWVKNFDERCERDREAMAECVDAAKHCDALCAQYNAAIDNLEAVAAKLKGLTYS